MAVSGGSTTSRTKKAELMNPFASRLITESVCGTSFPSDPALPISRALPTFVGRVAPGDEATKGMREKSC